MGSGNLISPATGERPRDGGETVCLSDIGVTQSANERLSSSSSTSTDQSDTAETSLLVPLSLLSILLLSPLQLLDMDTLEAGCPDLT